MSVTPEQTRSRRRPADQAAGGSRFRTDIQALRAVAITAVVVNHLWPGTITGGYVGVDVFFVISGFLITGHLMGEVGRTGGVKLGAFYARRIRRLLPAGLLVLLVSAILVAVFLPYPRFERNAWEIIASAGYVENWMLAALSVNYSAHNEAASVAQHYWSLSVEEQFYLVWPLLLLVAVGIAVWRKRSSATSVLIMLSAVAVLSLAASIWYTQVAPAQAYFATFTRAWEFAAGGLVALLASRIRWTMWMRHVLSALGLAAIAVAALNFSPQTAFPGYAALLPALGTAAVIAAGTGGVRLWHTPLTGSKPVQWVGDVSYSLYLWHWPLIVVAPFALNTALTTPLKLGILALALVLAWLTRAFVEKPGQNWVVWRTSVRRAVIGMLVGMAVVMASAGGLLAAHATLAADDSPTAPVPVGSCVGPDALIDPSACPKAFGPATDGEMSAENEYFFTPPQCSDHLDVLAYGDKLTTRICDYSGGAADATEVWLVGDSHAQQWQGAMFELAEERGWNLTISFFGGCPAADVAFLGFRGIWTEADADVCRTWSRDVSDAIEAAAPDLVFTAMASRQQTVDDGSGLPVGEQWTAGLQRDWDRWAAAGSQVFAIVDPPLNGEARDPECVALNAAEPIVCAVERSVAQPPDQIGVAAAASENPAVHLIDLTDRFCDEEFCYAVVGGVPVYYDADHLNLVYVRMLVPEFARIIDQAAGA